MAKVKSAKPETENPDAEKPATAEIPAAPDKVETVTASELNAVVEMPVANERTISAMAEDALTPEGAPSAPAAVPSATPTPSQNPKPGDFDKSGNAFDPEKHNPRLNRDGNWAGKQGRPKGGPGNSPKPAQSKSVVGTTDANPVHGVAPMGDRFDLAAELYTRASYSILDGAFAGGGEWLPENDGEHVALRGAVASYLRHKGTDDLPPGLAVSLAVATYGAKRISKPNTSTRLRLYFAWCRAKWDSWRTGRKIEALPQIAAPKTEHSPLPPVS